MFKIKLLLSFQFLCFLGLQLKAEKRKILFIGNSYTAVNDLPNTVKSLALSFGDSLEIDSNTPGGMTFNGHSTDPTTLAKIQLGGWDYVVLQAQSQEPSFDPTQVATDTYPYAKKLDSLIHVYNPCAETIFYMTWGRKNGDASNCAVYPPVCTYAGMQQRLRESYLEMTMNNNATCSPAGVAWKKVRDTYPLIELYNADESHPTISGTYLVACTFYSTLYHKSTVGSTFIPAGVLAADATNLQTMATNTVMDSVENWQQYGSLPRAIFSSTNIQNQFSFTNQSLRSTQYEWNFGDGSAINTNISPVHTYTTVGVYQVTLKAQNTCGKYDIFTKNITITSVPNSINNVDVRSSFMLNYSNSTISIHNNIQADHIKIASVNGIIVNEFELTPSFNKFLFSQKDGLYIYSIFSNHKMCGNGKFEVK